MTFDEQGLPIPTAPDNAIVRKRVETTVRLLHLDHDRLVRARKRKWRETLAWIEDFFEACPKDYDTCTARDHREGTEPCRQAPQCITSSCSAYAATARACLHAQQLVSAGPNTRRSTCGLKLAPRAGDRH